MMGFSMVCLDHYTIHVLRIVVQVSHANNNECQCNNEKLPNGGGKIYPILLSLLLCDVTTVKNYTLCCEPTLHVVMFTVTLFAD